MGETFKQFKLRIIFEKVYYFRIYSGILMGMKCQKRHSG